ncbi:MAG: hypothetical protein M1816_004710 [Peltula sp. TS41687]|nr:MAG: hypothetical protein M1816_004710 [Peltula sp. TS41687]
MPLSTPYTHVACPCVDSFQPITLKRYTYKPPNTTTTTTGEQADRNLEEGEEEEEEEEQTFDPTSARANYLLYPISHLFYCEDCREIRCPRCVTEEIMYWYCPNCLFEVPSSIVKGEGNKYVCPQAYTKPL